jgi:hypothetical protein
MFRPSASGIWLIFREFYFFDRQLQRHRESFLFIVFPVRILGGNEETIQDALLYQGLDTSPFPKRVD